MTTHKHRVTFGNPRCAECGARLVYRGPSKKREECKEGQHLLPAGHWDGNCVNCGRFCWKLPGAIGAYVRGSENLS